MNIELSEDFGYVNGYTLNLPEDIEKLVSYLQTHQVFDSRDVANELATKYSSIAILHEMRVDESQQGKGQGKELLRSFISKSPVDAVILIADSEEPQRKNFNLEQFYLKSGFQFLEESGTGSLLFLAK